MPLRTLLRATLPGAFTGALIAAVPAGAQEAAKVEWIGSGLPQTPEQMAAMWTDARVRVTSADGTVREQPLAYETLMTTADRIGGNAHPVGAVYDSRMRPIPDPTTPGRPIISQTPDGSALIRSDGRLYHLSNLEYVWIFGDGTGAGSHAPWDFTHADGEKGNMGGLLPTTVSLTELAQDPATGALTAVAQRPIDFAPVGGLAVACNAYETPWSSFLTSEENFKADGRRVAADRAADPSGGSDNLAGLSRLYLGGAALANPYDRGFLTEVTVGPNGATRVERHYAIGRGTFEMGLVMPDRRTVFAAHDGTNMPLTLFVADVAGDLTAGTLYAARIEQTGAGHGGTFDVGWVKLGHATNAEVRALIDAGTGFADIFDESDKPAPGFTEVRQGDNKNPLYLRVRDETAAAFLETLRYASLKGATTEFRKAEGVAFDPASGTAYVAMSEIDKGMLEGDGSGDGGDQIRLPVNKSGAVYAFAVAGGRADSEGVAIDSAYGPVSAHVPRGLLGADMAAKDALGNESDPDRIAGPDNIFWSAAYGTLFIGEDTGRHVNNALWAWQPGMETPVRLLTAPVGAELTGLRVYSDIGGHAYALTNAQHLGDFKPEGNPTLERVMELIKANWSDRQAAPIGYLSGLPRVAVKVD